MQLLQAVTKTQQYATRKDIARIFCYKNPSQLLKDFRDYAVEHPNTFLPHKPFIKNKGMDTLYDILAFAYYFENKDLLEAGTRSITFKEELTRLRQVYQ
ncbi:hypothetical protein FEZ48_03510 [Marinilactibacillus psychrotolerans]|uniref:Uncharacterized protein n=1 Tax=Marinilactibacillus psychrotolerans TaxID=191770 RepID=A0A5R9C6C5_9LACT|nr:hypothetical protein [Marinilactibacillus psychrotolerans]TLQ08511.1 hypothetical protein FEZ48_03510 [Marinilactibacillus psychrotolerans]